MIGTFVVFCEVLPLCCAESEDVTVPAAEVPLGLREDDPEVLDTEDGETGDVPELDRRPPHLTSVEPDVRIGCGDTPHWSFLQVRLVNLCRSERRASLELPVKYGN